jgi:hypothetical protein
MNPGARNPAVKSLAVMRNLVTKNPAAKNLLTKVPDRKSRGAEPKFGPITLKGKK